MKSIFEKGISWLKRDRYWLFEWGMILVWTLWVGRAYLDFSWTVWPHGREFGMSIQPHYIWQWLGECGRCIYWNGLLNGGNPAFVELHAGVLHPLVVVGSLLFGAFNGAKVVLLGSLFLAGVGQWWLAEQLGFGRLARIWLGLMGVVGGHLAGKMQMGVVGVVLSLASCALVIPALIQLSQPERKSKWRQDIVVLGGVLALAIVSGQGYIQLGLLLGVLPATIWLMGSERIRIKELVLAGFIALLLSALFWVPLVHFWPQFGKAVDPFFSSVQPAAYIPFTYLIADSSIYEKLVLNPQPYSYLYNNYIGWIPVLLAIVGVGLMKRENWRLFAFLGSSLILLVVVAGGAPFRLLAYVAPDFATGIRNPSLIAGLGVPFIFGFAGFTVDYLDRQQFPEIKLEMGEQSWGNLSTKLFFLAPLLLMALYSGYEYSQSWLFTVNSYPSETAELMDIFQAEDVAGEWMAVPMGDLFWGPIVAEEGIKLTMYPRPSHWRGRDWPHPYLQGGRNFSSEELERQVAEVGGMVLLEEERSRYAVVEGAHGVYRCVTAGKGGRIKVSCSSPEAGRLIVRENYWDGWQVLIDGEKGSFLSSRWLEVEVDAGLHQYEFNYLPGDIRLGWLLMGMGIYFVGWLLWVERRELERNKGQR